MVYWFGFRALLISGMLHPINSKHKNHRHRQISSKTFPYSQYKFIVLYLSIDQINYCSLIRLQSHCYLTFIWVQYTKFNKTYYNTYQPRHSCTTSKIDTTHSTSPSAYIAIRINSTINSCCTPPCASASGLVGQRLASNPSKHQEVAADVGAHK